jgi:hypothetical protein
VGVSVVPCGTGSFSGLYPGLTPGTKICRPFGAGSRRFMAPELLPKCCHPEARAFCGRRISAFCRHRQGYRLNAQVLRRKSFAKRRTSRPQDDRGLVSFSGSEQRGASPRACSLLLPSYARPGRVGDPAPHGSATACSAELRSAGRVGHPPLRGSWGSPPCVILGRLQA